jgi:hypothetical protein
VLEIVKRNSRARSSFGAANDDTIQSANYLSASAGSTRVAVRSSSRCRRAPHRGARLGQNVSSTEPRHATQQSRRRSTSVQSCAQVSDEGLATTTALLIPAMIGPCSTRFPRVTIESFRINSPMPI